MLTDAVRAVSRENPRLHGVTVEDAPFLAVELDMQGQGRGRRLIFRTNLDDIVTAGPDHPLRVDTAPDGTPAPDLALG